MRAGARKTSAQTVRANFRNLSPENHSYASAERACPRDPACHALSDGVPEGNFPLITVRFLFKSSEISVGLMADDALFH